MKCELCLNLLEEYLDGELSADDQERVSEHLITCAACAEEFAVLTAEQEMFARYDREIKISPAVWSGVEEQIVPVAETSYGWWMKIAAAVILTIGLGSVYLFNRKENITTPTSQPEQQQFARVTFTKPLEEKPRILKRTRKPIKLDNPDVFSSDLASLDLDDQDTVKHIERTENLLRSIRNVRVADGDEEIDVTYDKALSQRLLNENVVLRREAEMKAKFPTKTLLADIEPLLIDIANLPDHARPEDVQAIKERVQKTEIVAALTDYKDRGVNNR